MVDDFKELSAKILKIAKNAGADAADVLLVDGTMISIEVRAGILEHVERSEGMDVGLRVFIGQKQACVSVSDLSDHTILQMAERGVAMAKEAPDDPYCGLAEPEQLAVSWDLDALELYDNSPEPSVEKLQDNALEAEASALLVQGVSQVQGASSSYSKSRIHLATSNGFSAGYLRSTSSISCVAIAGNTGAMERDWSGEARSHALDLPLPNKIGTLAGERAVSRMNATRPTTGNYPVLFDERISSSLIGHMMAAVNATSIIRGSSWLKDDLGSQILPKGLDLIEDPTRKYVGGSRPFDAEGLPVSPRYIIRDGNLESWTLDLASARQLGLQTTGNASRGISSPPSPSSGNLALTQGKKTFADLIADMGTGMIVTSMIGATINPTNGDYSRGAAGLWVENGEIVGPINGCTIAGNLRDMLGRIIPANDARMHLSRTIPSLLVEGMTIAGI